MTILQYLNAFCVYGADTLLLALGVTLFTSLLKKTALKKCPKKVYVFLPFLIGILFFAAYRAVLTRSVDPFTNEITQTLEGGFACGCVATLYYVVYEQFLRTASNSAPSPQTKLYPVKTLLSGIIPESQTEKAAKELTEGSKNKSGNELLRFVLDTLRNYAAQTEETQCVTEGELFLYAKTVSGFLSATTE